MVMEEAMLNCYQKGGDEMEGLKVQQTNAINKNAAFLKKHLEGKSATPENIVDALCLLCPNVPEERIRVDNARILCGYTEFLKAYGMCGEDNVRTDTEQILQYFAKDMSLQQQKGFYLQYYEYLRQFHENVGIVNADSAKRPEELADLPCQQLIELLAGQIQGTAEVYMSEISEIQENTNAVNLPDGFDFCLAGAAAYAAGVQGDLPVEYLDYPEILGACMAACGTLREKTEVLAEGKKEGFTNREKLKKIIFLVLKVVLVVLVTVAVAMLLIHVMLPAAANMIDALLAAVGPNVSGWILDSPLGWMFLRNFAGLIPVYGIVGGMAAGYQLSEALELSQTMDELEGYYEGLESGETAETRKTDSRNNTEKRSTMHMAMGQIENIPERT